jgi:hypothetical protein
MPSLRGRPCARYFPKWTTKTADFPKPGKVSTHTNGVSFAVRNTHMCTSELPVFAPVGILGEPFHYNACSVV